MTRRMTSGGGAGAISRRGMISGVAVSAAALSLGGGLGGSGAVVAQAAPHRFKLGQLEVWVISDGIMVLPPAFVLPDTPEAERMAVLGPALVNGVMPAQVNVAVIKAGGATVLIDTGAGPDFMPTLGKLGDRLSAAGIAPDSITHVVFTHAHPDHLWGVIDPLGDGSAFGKAKHVMTAVERDYWLKPGVEKTVPAALEGMTVGTVKRLKAIEERITAAKPGDEIVPGIALIDTAGHTPGHVSVHVRSGGESLVVGGDALSQSLVSFEKPEWRWGADLDGDKSVASRKRLLDQLASEKLALVGYHLPWPGLGRVERKGTAYRFVQG